MFLRRVELNRRCASSFRFSINNTTGSISSNALLDYDTHHSYEFTVVASDNALGKKETDSTKVTILLTDVNDNVPVISNLPYTVNVKENVKNKQLFLVSVSIAYWQPYLKGLIQEIREYDWFKLLASGICTERYQYCIHNNHNCSKVACNHEFRCNAVH